MPAKLIKVRVKTPEIWKKKGKYTVSVYPWKAEVHANPQKKNRLTWTCEHNGTPVPLAVVLKNNHPFLGPQNTLSGLNPVTTNVAPGTADGVYHYGILVDLGSELGRIELDPEYERKK